MKNLNLLPHDIAKSNTELRLKKPMQIMQLAIFACIGLGMFLVTFAQGRLDQQIVYYAWRIGNLDTAPIEAAMETEQRHRASLDFYAFYQENYSNQFQTLWLETIYNNLPQGATLTRLSFNHNQGLILFTGETQSILGAQAHINYLINTGLFENVSQGRISLLESGVFSYEVRIAV